MKQLQRNEFLFYVVVGCHVNGHTAKAKLVHQSAYRCLDFLLSQVSTARHQFILVCRSIHNMVSAHSDGECMRILHRDGTWVLTLLQEITNTLCASFE